MFHHTPLLLSQSYSTHNVASRLAVRERYHVSNAGSRALTVGLGRSHREHYSGMACMADTNLRMEAGPW